MFIEEKSNNKRLVNRTNVCKTFTGEWKHTSSTQSFFNEESYFQENTVHAVDTSGQCYEVKDGSPIPKEKMVSRNVEVIAEEFQGRRTQSPVYK